MKNNIIMERIWQDDYFFEISLHCISKSITASTEIYITDSNIDDLYNKINEFIKYPQTEILWQCGEFGDHSTPSVSFNFIPIDSLGHIQIEIFMELNDGGKLRKHNCCFYVNTNIGDLYNFSNILKKIKQPIIGTRITLVSDT